MQALVRDATLTLFSNPRSDCVDHLKEDHGAAPPHVRFEPILIDAAQWRNVQFREQETLVSQLLDPPSNREPSAFSCYTKLFYFVEHITKNGVELLWIFPKHHVTAKRVYLAIWQVYVDVGHCSVRPVICHDEA